MNIQVAMRPAAIPRSDVGFVDCDIHPTLRSESDLDAYLPERWKKHRETVGVRIRQAFSKVNVYPRISPGGGVRGDAWPEAGGLPGSDLGLMQRQHLDLFEVKYGLMMPLNRASDERNIDFGAAIATAINEWQLNDWADQDPRLKASVQIAVENAEASVAEIERRAGDKRFVQVSIPPRSLEPLGRRRYVPILEAAAANGFPVAFHLGGASGHPPTGTGYPSFYHEEHPSYAQSMEALLTSLVIEGAFERIPGLKVVLIEGGMAWLPALCWRLDAQWAKMRDEVPHLKRPPSEYIRERVWVTTQPIDEPERPEDLVDVFEWIGWDRIMFSSDYPHWDQDDPRYAFRIPLPDDKKQMIMRGNALALYGLA